MYIIVSSKGTTMVIYRDKETSNFYKAKVFLKDRIKIRELQGEGFDLSDFDNMIREIDLNLFDSGWVHGFLDRLNDKPCKFTLKHTEQVDYEAGYYAGFTAEKI